MPGQHSNSTISFRPTPWERAMIEERVRASGLYKKDFIARSCIYSNIVVVGKRQRIQYLIEELREMQIVMKEIAEQMLFGDFSMTEDSYKEMKADYLAFIITMVDILNGAAYLFEQVPRTDNRYWKEQQEIQEYSEALKKEIANNMDKNDEKGRMKN